MMKLDRTTIFLLFIGSIFIAIIISLSGCGSDIEYISRKNSILSGQKVTFETNPDAILTFNVDQTFVYQVSGVTPCESSGTWIDNDIGASVGMVQMTFATDTCNIPNLDNQTQVYQYVVEDRILTITSPSEEL